MILWNTNSMSYWTDEIERITKPEKSFFYSAYSSVWCLLPEALNCDIRWFHPPRATHLALGNFKGELSKTINVTVSRHCSLLNEMGAEVPKPPFWRKGQVWLLGWFWNAILRHSWHIVLSRPDPKHLHSVIHRSHYHLVTLTVPSFALIYKREVEKAKHKNYLIFLALTSCYGKVYR